MSKATAFYFSQKVKDNNFHTPYANCYLYTYRAGTNTLIDTYKDQNETPNTNPILLDEQGSCTIFIAKGLSYKYVFKDAIGNTLATYDNIKQLAGADGGQPAPFNPTPEELEKFRGRPGVQGISVIGPDGEPGDQGLRGPDFYTSVQMLNNQEIQIPPGISEIYITASGGGGAGANFTNALFIYDVLSTTQQDQNDQSILQVVYKDQSNINTSKNKNRHKDRDLAAIYFLPGSGYAGQAIYRYKIVFDDNTKYHTVQAYVGNGGTKSTSTTNLNGGNGSSTKIYVDDKLVLELAGGVGGKQQIPYLTNTFQAVSTLTIQENQGLNSGYLYVKLNMNKNSKQQNFYRENTRGDTDWADTSYYKKTGNTFTVQDISVKLYFREQGFNFNANYASAFPIKEIKNINGEKSIFDDYYSSYQKLTQESNTGNNLVNSKKTVNQNTSKGYGAGGDCAYNYYFSKSNQVVGLSTFGLTSYMLNVVSSFDFYFADKEYMKSVGQTLLKEFEPNAGDAEAYSPGITTSIPDTFFNSLDVMITELKQRTGGLVFEGPGLYRIPTKFLETPGANNPDSYGDYGQPGFAIIEYGNITEVKTQEE